MEIDLDELEIRDIGVYPSETANTLDFKIEGRINGLDEETIGKFEGKNVTPAKLVCEVEDAPNDA